jgi:hypothetical protein
MSTCFVMQVFDGGPYDRRYEETFAPAIQTGGAVPVRADKILGTKPVIEKIEAALRDATIAFAEISGDNPNVFTELGYALDQGIPIVLVCDRAKRKSLPFDISHRPVIFYKTESQGDFEQLSRDVEGAIAAALVEANERQAKRIKQSGGIDQPGQTDDLKNRIALAILEGEIGDPEGISAYRLLNAVSREGTSERLASLAILGLTNDAIITSSATTDRDGDAYVTYQLTDKGKSLLLGQYAEIKRAEENQQRERPKPAAFTTDLDDDVPF